MKTPLCIIGASGHAKVVLDAAQKQGCFNIIGVLDANRPKGDSFHSVPVLGDDSTINSVIDKYPNCQFVVAIGDNWIRSKVVTNLKELLPSINFAVVVHPSAQIGIGANLSEGTVVFAQAVINAETTIGKHCIINTTASIDHDGCMKDYSSLAPGAILGGNVNIGTFSSIGIGATILHSRSISEHTIIGAGAVVTKDCPSHSIVYGCPARKIRDRNQGEQYL